MNRHIEEMALALSEGVCGKECDCIQGDKFNCHLLHSASVLYNAGYRKASEVAREIIKEIDDALHDMATEYHKAGHPEYFAVCEMVHHKVIRPIEKKYESEVGE